MTNKKLDKYIDAIWTNVNTLENVDDFIKALYHRWINTRPRAFASRKKLCRWCVKNSLPCRACRRSKPVSK